MKSISQHIPVLLNEVIEYLNPQVNQNFVDCTLGGGGHSQEILKKTAPKGKLLAFDLDPQAIVAAKENLKDFAGRIIFINDNYKKLKTKIYEFKFDKINGIICDLGYSSFQVDEHARGFSFHSKESLDLRYSPDAELTGEEVVNNYSEERLTTILSEYGEEPLSKTIAREIIAKRKKQKVSALGLKQIIEGVYAHRWRTPSRIHPATRTWQALRIEVNDELGNIEEFLPQGIEVLEPGARLGIISFHSIEDRVIKNYFRKEAKDCICPPQIPKCVCEHRASIKIINKKPITATKKELEENPRSRTAKLRVVEKL